MIERTIFNYLLKDNDYFSTVYPYLDETLFEENKDYNQIFKKITIYLSDYSVSPTYKDIKLLVTQDSTIDEKDTKTILKELDEIKNEDVSDNNKLVIKETEKWVRDERMKTAILESVEILDKNQDKNLIFDKIKQVVSISFDKDIGVEYFVDIRRQLEFYTEEIDLVKSKMDTINKLFGGGFRKKTLNAFIATTNAGKCSSYETIITIRNKRTLKVEEIKIGDFYKLCQN